MPILSTLGLTAEPLETACLTGERLCCNCILVSRASRAVFDNITTFIFHVFLSAYLRHLDAVLTLNSDCIVISTPKLYPKVRLVYHARSGQFKCLIYARG